MAAKEEEGVSTIQCRWGWVVTFAAFLQNLLSGGIFSIHGLLYKSFLDTYLDMDRTSAALVISLQAGLCYLGGMISGSLLAVWSSRQLCIIAGFLMSLGLVVTAFTSTTVTLYIFFSLITGIGMGLQTLPTGVLVQLYFDKNRSLAAAIALCGGTVGMFVYPPLCYLLTSHYGWRGMLLVVSGITLHVIPLALLMRPPPKDQYQDMRKLSRCDRIRHGMANILDCTALRHLLPWVTMLSWFFIFSGQCAFNTFITVRCTVLQFHVSSAAILISISGILETFGRLGSGVLGNFKRINRMYVFTAGITICGISSVISGFVMSFPLLTVYAAVFGLNIGVFAGIGCTIIVDLVGKQALPKVHGLNFAAGGVGNFVALPVFAFSWKLTENPSVPFFISGSIHILASLFLLVYYLTSKRKTSGEPVVELDMKETFLDKQNLTAISTKTVGTNPGLE